MTDQYSEYVPVVHIVGYPKVSAVQNKDITHHSLGTSEFGRVDITSHALGRMLRNANI